VYFSIRLRGVFSAAVHGEHTSRLHGQVYDNSLRSNDVDSLAFILSLVMQSNPGNP